MRDGWRACAMPSSAAPSLVCTRRRLVRGACTSWPARWARPGPRSPSASRTSSDARPCSTSRAGACSWRRGGSPTGTPRSRRSRSRPATTRRRRSAAPSGGPPACRRPSGGGDRARAPPRHHAFAGAEATDRMDAVVLPSFLASRTQAAPDGIGKPVRRKEDARLLTGAGRFGDDVNLPGQAHAAFVRSPHAHARIGAIDTAAALGVPGVLAVLTGADAAAAGLRPIPHRPVPTNPHEVPLRSRDGSEFFVAPHRPLPVDRARFVGEPVAMVVAETAAAARDGADRVRVDWAPLAAVTTAAAAVAAEAPALYAEHPGNLCVDSRVGDLAATEAAFARAAHVVTLTTRINRVTGVPMEPRTALASYDETTARYTLHAGSGGVQRCRADLAGTLGVPEDAVRVIAGDVGGNYGTRNSSYPEFSLVAWAARRLRRPVKWTCDRTEALLTDYQSRDLHAEVSLALDRDGAFLALRGTNTSNVGAHAVSFIPLAKGIGVLPSVYRIPTALMDGRAVLTNTAPTTPYRSAGRPEVMFVIERLI